MSDEDVPAATRDNGALDPRHELKDRIKDLGVGLVLACIGAFAIYHINTRTAVFESSGAVAFNSVPTICGILLIGLVALYSVLSLQQIIVIRRTLGSNEFRLALLETLSLPPMASGTIRRAGTVVLLVTYVLSLRTFPFFVSTTAFLGLMFILYGQRSAVRIVVVTLAGSSALTLLFVYVLRLRL